MAVTWVETLPKSEVVRHGRRVHDWDAVANELRRRPGKWALVAQGVSRTYAYRIKQGLMPAFAPAGTFVTRTVGPRGPNADLFVAYVGVPGARLTAESEAPWK